MVIKEKMDNFLLGDDFLLLGEPTTASGGNDDIIDVVVGRGRGERKESSPTNANAISLIADFIDPDHITAVATDNEGTGRGKAAGNDDENGGCPVGSIIDFDQ